MAQAYDDTGRDNKSTAWRDEREVREYLAMHASQIFVSSLKYGGEFHPVHHLYQPSYQTLFHAYLQEQVDVLNHQDLTEKDQFHFSRLSFSTEAASAFQLNQVNLESMRLSQ